MTTQLDTAFFDDATFTVTYVVADPVSNVCAVVDPVLDYDAASGRTSTTSVNAVIDFIEENSLTLDWALETHIHADHISAAALLKATQGMPKLILLSIQINIRAGEAPPEEGNGVSYLKIPLNQF